MLFSVRQARFVKEDVKDGKVGPGGRGVKVRGSDAGIASFLGKGNHEGGEREGAQEALAILCLLGNKGARGRVRDLHP